VMRRSPLFLPVAAFVTLAALPAAAQTPSLYTRHPSAHVERDAPIPETPQPGGLTADQKLAIAPVRWPAVWPAPKIPAGTVLTVPPRPNWQPQPGEYWGPFVDDGGAWGFMVGPHGDTPASATAPPMLYTRFGAATPAAASPRATVSAAAPKLPVAGPVSPDGKMVVSYPDGKQATWQLPMVSYRARFTAIRADGTVQLTDSYNRQGVFSIAGKARITLNGAVTDLSRLPIGAAVTARALRLAPATLTVLDAIK
jgi:hypothetical protein